MYVYSSLQMSNVPQNLKRNEKDKHTLIFFTVIITNETFYTSVFFN